MEPSCCRWLDDYLARDLADGERDRFIAHLTACPACRQAVDQAQQLDALLGEATERLEAVPADLADRVRVRLHRARLRRLAGMVATFAAAVALLAGTAWLLGRPSPRSEEPTPLRTEKPAEQPRTEVAQSAGRVRVRFPAGANVIAVPKATTSPDVTVIWIYPGLRQTPGPVSSLRVERNRQ